MGSDGAGLQRRYLRPRVHAQWRPRRGRVVHSRGRAPGSWRRPLRRASTCMAGFGHPGHRALPAGDAQWRSHRGRELYLRRRCARRQHRALERLGLVRDRSTAQPRRVLDGPGARRGHRRRRRVPGRERVVQAIFGLAHWNGSAWSAMGPFNTTGIGYSLLRLANGDLLMGSISLCRMYASTWSNIGDASSGGNITAARSSPMAMSSPGAAFRPSPA